jgi:hypothetical protein
MRVGIGVVPGVAAGTPEYWLSFGVSAVAPGATSGPAIAIGLLKHDLVVKETVRSYGGRNSTRVRPDVGKMSGSLITPTAAVERESHVRDVSTVRAEFITDERTKTARAGAVSSLSETLGLLGHRGLAWRRSTDRTPDLSYMQVKGVCGGVARMNR